ncbi:MAG: cofactor-independent phosphoglycerate mutase [Nitrospiraceae bacterium]|nr:cofactor-independent phosphoglycerate mutase [Nitrospiraceae bacterium]
MKYVILLGDGMADRPVEALAGRTPLAAAFTPNMDRLAKEGACGAAMTLPEGLPSGSDVANLGILGYDPVRYYTGRAPLEAASMGITLGSADVAFRCNLVTLKFNREKTRACMEDHSAGQLSTEEGRILIEDLNRALGSEKVRFYPGVSYRHLMLLKGGNPGGPPGTPAARPNGGPGLECTPPHDILGREISEYLPHGAGDDAIRDLMRASVDVLERHPINRRRAAEGKRPANSIWLWGQGGKPELPPFAGLYGCSGAMVSAVDLAKGLAVSAGMKVIDVPGATGYLDTNYAGKAEYAMRALREGADLVYIHVEAPDEASHEGSLEHKIKAIEDFDALLVGAVMKGMKEFGRFRALLMPDHATPLLLRTHSRDPVPFVIYDSGFPPAGGSDAARGAADHYDESILMLDGIMRLPAHKIMGRFLERV